MKSKPAPRCHHVSTSGIQCGSPAVGKLRYCYYHQQGRSTATQYYSEMAYTAIEEDLPLFEDAHSIQIAIRQIASLLIQRKIEHKAAGLLLYSIQLALFNLKQLKAEKPHPAQLVVELEKFEETLPESAFIETAPPESNSEDSRKPPQSERNRKKSDKQSKEQTQHLLEELLLIGEHLDDPAGSVPEIEAVQKRNRELYGPKDKPGGKLPPGTIQACATRRLRAESRRAN